MDDSPRAGRRHYDATIAEQIEGHNDNEFAHGEAFKPFNVRLTTVEKWQQRTIGGVGMLTFIVTVFGVIYGIKIGLI